MAAPARDWVAGSSRARCKFMVGLRMLGRLAPRAGDFAAHAFGKRSGKRTVTSTPSSVGALLKP